MELIGLGSIAMDIFMKVNELPREDDFAIIEETAYQPGGSCANVVIQAARLGAKAGFSGCISDDSIGSDLIKAFKEEGVNWNTLIVKPGGTTIHTNIVVDREGRKFIMVDGGDCFYTLSEEELPAAEIAAARILYTDLFPAQPCIAGLKIAKNAGATTVFNMQAGLPTYEGMGANRDIILEALSYVDIFAPCKNGLYDLSQSQDLDVCIEFVRRHFKGLLVLTLGTEGSMAIEPCGKIHRAEAVPVQAVDTTGAGDSYIGAFMMQYCLRGMELPDALSFASACAGYTCTTLGARTSPNQSQAEIFCKERGVKFEP